jgi:hypothetical protein
LSTLTKVLIVLLSLASIFLSGTMVTFVATTENFKEVSDAQKEMIIDLEGKNAQWALSYAEKATQFTEQIKVLQSQRESMQGQLSDETLAKRAAQMERDELKAEISTWASSVTGFEGTIALNTETLKLTQRELTAAREKLIKLGSQLTISEAGHGEKIIQIERLNARVKNLIETKTELEKQIAALANGKTVSFEGPVTPIYEIAKAAVTAPSVEVLRGVVSQVSATLVGISIGSADGVAPGSVFHVTRGSEFICDLKITNVEINKSAGVIELSTGSPKVGDTISNRL